jgi:hypothetical protein
MNYLVFNACVLLGWLMATVGGCLLNLGAGLACGGVLLLVIVVAVTRMSGVFVPKARA